MDYISNVMLGWLVGWLVVLNVPSTARSFRDGAPVAVPCEGREARFLHVSLDILFMLRFLSEAIKDNLNDFQVIYLISHLTFFVTLVGFHFLS